MSTDNTRKKLGRPKVDSEEVSVRMQRSMLDRVDEWRANVLDQPNRPEAIRRLVQTALDHSAGEPQ